MSTNSDYLMRQFSRVNSAKQLPTADWDFTQPTPLLDSDHDTEERKLAVLIEWINTILPDLKLPPKASAEELRHCLGDGTVLLKILKKVRPGSVTEDDGSLEAQKGSASQNVQRFLDSTNERGIPKFEMADLEKGSMKRVVDCLLTLRARYPTGRNSSFPTSGRMTRSGSLREFSPYQSLHLGPFSSSLSSPGAERQSLSSDSKLQQFLRTSPALSESSAAWMHHAGHRFHEVFQVRQGRYADLSPSKISEMMKSTSLDNAPTQSLLSVVNGILDESIDRKNGEIPHRVACLLRKVVQEIERRISTQAEHLRTQNNLFKAREEKYQSRIRVLETLASGTGEDTTGIVMDQLPPLKGVKLKVEEKTKVTDEITKLVKEKEEAVIELARLRQELETTKTIYDDMVKLLKEKEKTDGEPSSSSSQQENVNREPKNTQVSSLEQGLAEGKKELNHIVQSLKDKDQQLQHEQKTNAEILALQQQLAATKKELNDMVDSTKEKDQLRHEQKTNTEVLSLQQELAATRKELNDMVDSTKEKDQLRHEQKTNTEVLSLQQELAATRKELNNVVTSVKEEDQRRLEVEATRKGNDDAVLASTAETTGRGMSVKQEVETRREGNGDEVARLMKEKDQMSLQITTLKQELETTRKGHDNDKARLTKEKEEMSVQLTTLQQELQTARQGQGDDAVRLAKEKDDMSVKLTALQQELETIRQEHEDLGRLMKEKDQAGQDQLSTLQQELETVREAHKDAAKLERELDSMRKARDEMATLVDEKDQANLKLAMSLQELEATNKAQEQKYLELEAETKTAAAGFEKRVKELETQLQDSRDGLKGLRATMESKQQSWSKKETSFVKSVNLQFHALHELRFSSTSIKEEIFQAQQDYSEKFQSLGVKFKTLIDASENYHLVLAENRKLFNELQDLRGNIRVYCRVRPFLPGQPANKSVVEYIGDKGELVVGNPAKTGKDARKMFRFNKVYGPEATQAEVYLDTQPLVQSVIDGYNVCIFAYGQTGSGKTYTMLGPNGAQEEEWGVNYRALKDLFNMSNNRSDSISYEVGVQMVEIYNEQVRDLLTNDAQKKLGILTTPSSNGIAVPDATMLPVSSTSAVMDLMQIGLNNRAVSATALNERSSRSHSVLSVHVQGKDLQAGTTLFGNLHLVDLAGSERVDRSEVTGDRLKEAQHINKSLSALGDVIFSLAQKSTHVPYRNSKLTQLLQSSLGGQAKTLMFVQLNPDATSYSESLSTLKFAERVTGIELGAAKSNPGKDVKELMEQLASLKDTIANKDEEIERLQVFKDLKNGYPSSAEKPPAMLRTRKSASGERGLGLIETAASDHSDLSDGEASVDSAADDAGKPPSDKPGEKRGARMTKARSLQRLSDARPSTTVTVSRDPKGSTSVKKTSTGSGSVQRPTSASSSRSRRA